MSRTTSLEPVGAWLTYGPLRRTWTVLKLWPFLMVYGWYWWVVRHSAYDGWSDTRGGAQRQLTRSLWMLDHHKPPLLVYKFSSGETREWKRPWYPLW